MEKAHSEGRAVASEADDLLGRIPAWLKSSTRWKTDSAMLRRGEKASEHLAAARKHLDDLLGMAKGEEPPNGPQTPLRKEGEV